MPPDRLMAEDARLLTLKKNTLAALLAAACALPAPATLLAQPAPASGEADATPTSSLPPIWVTSSDVPVRFDVPGTVTTIDRQQMDRYLVVNIRDLVQYEPGVSAIGAGGRFGLDSFNIRGLSGNRTRVEVDGVSMPASFGADLAGGSFRAGRDFIDLDTIKQVEIVRGPASALYPSDSLGGVVSLRTKDPADYLHDGSDVYAALKEQYSGVDRSLGSTATLAGGNHRQGIVFVFDHREGRQTDNQGDVDTTGATRTRPDPLTYALDSFMGKYVHTADSGRVDRVIADGTQMRTRTDSLSELGPSVPFYRSQDGDTRVRGSVGQSYPRLDAAVADTLDWNIYAQASHTRTRTQTQNLTQFGTTVDRYYDNLPLRERVYGGKLVAVKRFGDAGSVAQTLSYGIDVSSTHASSTADGYGIDVATGERGSDNRFLPGNYPMHLIPQSDTDRYAVFGQDRLDLAGGRLSIIPGVRVDRYAYRPQADALYLQLNDGYVQRDYTQTHASPKLGAVWHFDDALSLYADYAQGFRPPLYSEIAGAWNEQPIPGFNIAFLPNDSLKAETSRGIELGLRGNGDAGWFNLAAYYNRYHNFIWSGEALPDAQVPAWAYQISPGAGFNLFFRSVNAPRAVIRGAEASGALRLGVLAETLRGWELKASAAIASGKLIQPGDSGYSPLDTVDPARIVLGVSYSAARWGADLVGTAVRRHPRLSQPDAFRPAGYATLDLYAHYAPLPQLTLYAGISNLADRKYWDWGSLNGGTLGNFITGNGINDAGTGGIPADRLSMPGRAFSASVRLAF